MTPPKDVAEAIHAIPLGTSRGSAQGKRYVTTRSLFSEGRATKVVAKESGGKGNVSLNLYDLSSGARLYPYEMPSAKVIAFIRAYVPERV